MFTNLHRVVRLPSSRAALAPRNVRFKFAVPDAETSPRRRRLKPKLANSKRIEFGVNRFAALTAQFLDRVQTAVEPLLPPTNDAFDVDRTTKDVLMLRTDAKEFEIKIVSAKQQIHFTSPISGLRHYEWNAKTQRWEDETDSHDIEGLLTRDLMRLCSGVPQF